MGVITCDITGLGVVVTIDSQPTIISERQIEVANAPLDRPRLIRRESSDFSGYLTFVGTEEIGNRPTGAFLAEHSDSHPDTSLADYLGTLADDLNKAWMRNGLTTGLYIHAAGTSAGEAVFHIIKTSTVWTASTTSASAAISGP